MNHQTNNALKTEDQKIQKMLHKETRSWRDWEDTIVTGIFISHSKYDMDTVTCFSKAVVVNGIRGRGILCYVWIIPSTWRSCLLSTTSIKSTTDNDTI